MDSVLDDQAGKIWGSYKFADGASGKGRWARWAVDASEPTYGYCSTCPLAWGHRGPCALSVSPGVAPSRRKCAVAAEKTVSAIAKAYHNKKRRAVGGERRAAAAAPKEVPDQLAVVVPSRSSSMELKNVAVGVLLSIPGKVNALPSPPPPPAPAPATREYPTIEELLKEAKLTSFLEKMVEDGWDDVAFLHAMSTKAMGLGELGGMLPITKPGHLQRLVYAIRRLCD